MPRLAKKPATHRPLINEDAALTQLKFQDAANLNHIQVMYIAFNY